MPVCPHGVTTPSGRCQMCRVEDNWEHHEFLTDDEEEDE